MKKWFIRILAIILLVVLTIFLISFVKLKLNQAPSILYTDMKEELQKSRVPLVIIDTEEEIKNEPKSDAKMSIYLSDSLFIQCNIGIEYRGKTSYRLSSKKSFAFETRDLKGEEIDTSLLEMPAHNEWNLIGNVLNPWDQTIWDETMMYNFIGYNLSRKIGRYASRMHFVELVVNNKYLGLYTLGEKLSRHQDRIDIAKLTKEDKDISGGYIIAIDKAEPLDKRTKNKSLHDMSDDARYTKDICFRSKIGTDGKLMTIPPFGEPYHKDKYLEVYYNYVYPKAKDITSTQKQYIESFVDSFEMAMYQLSTKNPRYDYKQFIDVASFIDYFIINELCKNIDAYRLSTYMYKDKGKKLCMGPVWDMNIGFDSGQRLPDDDWVVNYNHHVNKDNWSMPFYWPLLLSESYFQKAVKTRWQELRKNELSDDFITNLIMSTKQYLIQNGAIQRNYKKWDKKGRINYNQSILDLMKFMKSRAKWMDEQIANF